MPGAHKVAVLVHRSDDTWEGLRSALGLMVENLVADCFFIDAPLHPPPGKDRFDFQDSLDLLAELEGRCFTTSADDAQAYEFMTQASLDEMAAGLGVYDLVIPF